MFLLLATNVALSQEIPSVVTLCDLKTNPDKYDRKLVEIRGRVDLAFENFSIGDETCDQYPPVWVMMGGDVGGWTASTFNDLERKPGTIVKVEGIKIPLQKDASLQDFARLVTAHREKTDSGKRCSDCYFYHVTATLMGRFFAGKESQLGRGYGHLGCCSLLTVSKVSDVVGYRTEVLPLGDVECTDHSRRFWIDDHKVQMNKQKLAQRNNQGWRKTDLSAVTSELLVPLQREWGESKKGRLVPPENPSLDGDDEFGIFESVEWVSDDGLSNYWVNLRKSPYLKKHVGDWKSVIWQVQDIQGHECHSIPVNH
jgi:hypothetical protein